MENLSTRIYRRKIIENLRARISQKNIENLSTRILRRKIMENLRTRILRRKKFEF